MPRQKFTEKECKEFEEVANPHQWLQTADLLHDQALVLYGRREDGFLFKRDASGRVVGKWASTNKATFLLCAFALENAIKAFLVYEHPAWIMDGFLHHEICNHRLVALSRQSSLIPYARRDEWVLARFEEGNESWMRYPCSRSARDLQIEPQLHYELWTAYARVMRGYGLRLMRLLGKGWKGPHGDFGRWHMSGNCLGAKSINALPSAR
jgi:hypothetical protein